MSFQRIATNFCRNQEFTPEREMVSMFLLRKSLIALLLSVCVVPFSATSLAQGTNATLSGTIVDPTGAAIAGSTITVTSNQTRIARTVHSDAGGRYVIPDLAPGTYNLVATSQGFKTKQVNAILLSVAQESHQDLQMTLGEANEVVSVQSSGEVTETETSAVGSIINEQQIVGIPLNQRNFYNLALLSPAADMPAQNSANSARGGFNVSGNNEVANTFLIDGFDDNDTTIGTPNFRPSVEGVQEFRLLTGIYAAEFGRTSGGQVVVVTKSGTDQYHGDLFFFLRNQVMDAVNYFTPVGAKPAIRRGQYGATFGGPIKRGRTFFFVDYEGMALAQQVTGNTTVPTNAEQLGDFSALLPATQLIDPTTGLAVPGNKLNLLPSWSSPSALEGRALAAEFPASLTGAYTFNETRTENLSQFSVRIDHKFSEQDSLLTEYNYFHDPSFEPSNNVCGSALIPHFGCYATQNSQLAGLGETHIFSASLLNEFRLDYNRQAQPRLQQDYDLPNLAPPLPNSFTDPSISTATQGSVYVNVSGLAVIGETGALPQGHTENQYQALDNVTYLHGKHTFKGGVDFRADQSNQYTVLYGRGGAYFNAGSAGALGGLTTKNSIADLMLGYPYLSLRSPTAPKMDPRFHAINAYSQDDWKVNPYLTLNLGVRYEYDAPVSEAHNQISTVVFNTPATPSSAGGASIVRAGTGGFGSYLNHEDLNNWAPRFGLAWQPFKRDSTVLHAGAGIFFSMPTTGNGYSGQLLQQPMRNTQSFTTSAAAPLTLANPYPAGDAGTSVAPSGIDPNFATLYMAEWSLGVQQQLSAALGLEVTYFGSKGTRIPNFINANQGIVTAAAPGYARPYPNFGNITIAHSDGNSEYQSLQTKLQEQYRHGLSFLLAYTYAKSVDNAPGFSSASASSANLPQNSLMPSAEHGLSDFNVKHRLVISPVYELPFGVGKAYLTSGLPAKVAGGWQLSSLMQVQTGRPFTILIPSNNSLSFSNEDRPNQIANPNDGPKTVTQWFKTAAFVIAPRGTFGNEHRNAVIGPGYVNFDVALQRKFRIADKLALDFRAESFNVFNHPNFLNPTGLSTGALGAAQYGQLTASNDGRDMQLAVKAVF